MNPARTDRFGTGGRESLFYSLRCYTLPMEFLEKVSLKDYTTFKIGGEAKFFCVAKNTDELMEAVIFARKEDIPFLVLGGGSNMLISDDGFSGLVIKMEIHGIEYLESGKFVEVVVGAGENWDEFVSETLSRRLFGLENLSGIPGTVGGAPVQNIGAYGVEVGEFVKDVEYFDTSDLKFKNLVKDECEFEYRDSVYKRAKAKKWIITRVTFRLQKKGKLRLDYKDVSEYFLQKNIKKPTLLSVRKAILEVRSRKFPDLSEVGTAGSFFKNPIVTKKHFLSLSRMYPDIPFYKASYGRVKIPLGWVLEHICGVKGVKINNVASFEKQALVLVNFGEAKSNDVYNYACEIERQILAKTGIEVEWEVRYVK